MQVAKEVNPAGQVKAENLEAKITLARPSSTLRRVPLPDIEPTPSVKADPVVTLGAIS